MRLGWGVRGLSVGTTGTGAITTTFAQAVDRTPGIVVTVVHSRDPDRGKDLAEAVGAERVVTSLRELLASDVDAVYVASPTSLHPDHVLACVREGTHVLVEKPAAPTAPRWADMVEAAQRAGVVVVVGMRNEYDPGMEAIREALPDLGPLRRASFRFEKRSSRYDDLLAGRRVNTFDPAMADGALLDLGVYCVHAMVTLFGPPGGVTAASVPLPSGADGAGVVVAICPGMVVDLCYSKVSTSRLQIEIQGEDATLVIDHIASPRSLIVHHRDGRVHRQQQDEAQHSLDAEVARFVELVGSGASPAGDQERTLQTLRMVDDVRAQLGLDYPWAGKPNAT